MNAEPLDLLLSRIRAGDALAVEELAASYEPYLRRLIRHSLPDRVRGRFDSADIVQSVWVHVLTGLQSGVWDFPDRLHLQAFLVKVARRRLISRIRKHYPAAEREATTEVPLDELPAEEQPRPSEVAQAEELWQRLLALCPPAHHELLQLRRQGLRLEEIARRTGLHEGSVRRVLRQLARQLTLQEEPLAST
jgi:RNA polymerase sigma-70 factor (ECF subfamily)